MTKNRHSIDGFVPRRPGGQMGESRHVGQPNGPVNELGRFYQPEKKPDAQRPMPTRSELGIARNDISESLKGIDSIDELPPKGKGGKKRRQKKPISKKRRIIKWSIIAVLVIILGIAGWMAYKALNAGSNIFKGSIFDIIQNQPLKEDANGRSNILILGTSEDDPGHAGAYLTDSMMVMSINQHDKSAEMFSIPRDLYVQYGMACNSGYQGKINEYFNCVNSDWKNKQAEQERLDKTRQFVGGIFGMDIQYAVHVNNTVIKKAVDAVGGVDVDIQGDGPVPYGVPAGSILDRNFDWRCNYQCYLVKYTPGVHHLDGKHALYLSMARGDTAPTYGLAQSNFDREKNQQKIIIALKQKAVSTGTFANPAKVSSLLDALGDNLRTNFETKEIRTLMQLGTDIKPENIKQISLYDGDTALVKSANFGGASVVIPAAGAFNYSEIQAFLKQKLSNNPVTREGAKVVVLNASGEAGAAQTAADKLTADGFIISNVGNAPAGDYGDVEVYQLGKGNSATKAKLESEYNVKVKTSTPPVTVAADTDFVVILGKAPSSND